MGNAMNDRKYDWEHEDHQQQIFVQVLDLKSRISDVSAFVQNSYVRLLGDGMTTPEKIAGNIPYHNST